MAKMGKPEMTVVRFRAEDVIATSVAGIHFDSLPGLQAGIYNVFGRELIDAGITHDNANVELDIESAGGYNYSYTFWYVIVGNSAEMSNPGRAAIREAPYAWFDNNTWHTGNYIGASLDMPVDNAGKKISDAYPGQAFLPPTWY